MRHLSSRPLVAVAVAAALTVLSGCTVPLPENRGRGLASSSGGPSTSSGSSDWVATSRAIGDETFLDNVAPSVSSGSGCGGPVPEPQPSGGSRPGATAGRLSADAEETPSAAAEAANASVAHALSSDGKTLYALSATRGLQILDVSKLDGPVVAGRVPLPGTPVALHVSGSMAYIVLLDLPWSPASGSSGAATSSPPPRLWSVDVSNPAAPLVVSRVVLPGPLVGSRLVGHVLYSLTSTSPGAGLVLASHDLRDPASPREVARIDVPGSPSDLYPPRTFAEFGEDRITLASSTRNDGVSDVTVFQVFDLTDPDGAVTAGARFEHAGLLRTMHHAADRKVFAAVLVPTSALDGATVALWSSPSPAVATPAGSTTPLAWTTWATPGASSGPISPGSGVNVEQALIEGTRAWLVGSDQGIRLVDMTDPAHPVASPSPVLLPPEFDASPIHLQARGDRLFVLTHSRDRFSPPAVRLAILDGKTAASPRLVGSVLIATGGSSTTSADGWTASSSDPARAFQVLDGEGFVAVPTTAGPDATRWTGHVSLLDVSGQTLAAAGTVPYAPGARALALPGRTGQVALLSAGRLSIVDTTARGAPRVRAELDLSSRVSAVGSLTAGRIVQLAGAGAAAELRVTYAQAPEGAPLARVGVPGAWLLHQAGSVAWVVGTALTAVELADPLDPRVLGTLDLVAASAGAGGAWGYASEYAFEGTTLVVHRSVVDGGQPVTIARPDSGTVRSQGVGILCGPAPEPIRVLAAAAADTATGHDLLIFDLSASRAPRLAARVALPGARGFGLTISGGLAWTMRWEAEAGASGVGRSFTDAVDLSDPAHPAVLSLNVPGVVVGADPGGKRIFTVDHVREIGTWGSARWTDVHALDLTDRRTARLAATVHVAGAETGFARIGERGYLTTSSGLSAVDLARMKLASEQPWGGDLQAVAGGKLFLAAPAANARVYGLADPDRPAFEQGVVAPGWASAGGTAVVEGGVAYLPSGAGGITRLPLGP